MSVYDPPVVLEILRLSLTKDQSKFVKDWKNAVEKRVDKGLSGRTETPLLRLQLEWEAHIMEYVLFINKQTTVNGNNKTSTGPPPLAKGIPILGPRFIPPGFLDVSKRGGTNITPLNLYLCPLNIIHPFYYPSIACCPQCASKDIAWKGWTGEGARKVHGIRIEERALGYQLRCNDCEKKYGKGGTDIGASNADGEKLGCSFATTNSVFWDRWEHWKIPRGVPYFMYRSAVTRELFDFIVEMRPSTTAGRLAGNIKQFHLLEYKQRHLEYLNAFKTRLVPALGPKTCILQTFSTPDDSNGYNDKSITDDLISDVFLLFSNRTRIAESTKYLQTLSAVCMNLDNTYKVAKKATVVDESRARTKLMKGGILSILNENNIIISWRFCQSGSATEIVELLEGLKARLELLGVPLPEMVTVDNCCTVGNKIRDVLPLIKVLLDVYHFIMRYAAGILGGVHNPQRTAVLKDIKEAILKVPSSKGVLAQYWSQGEQETRLTAAYDKWLQRGVWSAAAQNIHAAQMQHVRKGCLARPREDIASDGSRIEGSHKGWNDLQRANASGLVTMTVLGHDHVLRRNIRVALNGKSAAPTPFITSTFGSHHISLVDHTASIWNDLLTSSHNSSSQLVPLPRLPDINSGEKFGLVNSVHTESFGGLFTIKEEPEDDANVVKELDLDEQEDLMRELNLNAAQFMQPMLAPLQPPSTSTLNVGTSDFGSVNADNEIRTGVISTAPDFLVIPAEASLSSGSTQGIKRKSISASTDLSTSCADAPSEPKKVRLDSERPMHPLFGRSTSSLTSSQSPTAVPNAAPKIKSLGELTAPLPEPESSAGLPKLTRSQLFFTISTGTDPRSLQIHRGKEFFLFMTMRREFQWKSYEMKSRNWVEATREYNTRLRQLPDGGQLISKNPRALLDQLGDIEQKIATRIINNDFTSASGKTAFWTSHCHAVPFIKVENESNAVASTSTSTDNAVKPLRKPQTCTRCKTIKYPGPSGSPENHKKSFCSDGFRPTLKGETVPAWPLPPGIFTNGTDFHPLVFLAGVRELYEALVIQRVNREDFSMEDEAFYQLLSARVTLDKATGAVMFKLYSELNVPDSDGVPEDMYIDSGIV
ncbi:hypothetical protein C8R43DRAFT_1180381 [Mycena crocata]|nr:hypothetical protein C8R43DRAFT_1180381 [Mycena crocata]